MAEQGSKPRLASLQKPGLSFHPSSLLLFFPSFLPSLFSPFSLFVSLPFPLKILFFCLFWLDSVKLSNWLDPAQLIRGGSQVEQQGCLIEIHHKKLSELSSFIVICSNNQDSIFCLYVHKWALKSPSKEWAHHSYDFSLSLFFSPQIVFSVTYGMFQDLRILS